MIDFFIIRLPCFGVLLVVFDDHSVLGRGLHEVFCTSGTGSPSKNRWHLLHKGLEFCGWLFCVSNNSCLLCLFDVLSIKPADMCGRNFSFLTIYFRFYNISMILYPLFLSSWPLCCSTCCFKYKFAWGICEPLRKSFLSVHGYFGRPASLAWVVFVNDCPTSHIWQNTECFRGILSITCSAYPYDKT